MVVFHCGNPRNDYQITQMTIFQPKPVHRVITLCEAGRTKHAGLSQTELNQKTTALSLELQVIKLKLRINYTSRLTSRTPAREEGRS